MLRGALRNVYKNLPQKEALQLLDRIYKHTKQRNKTKADEKRVAEPKPQKVGIKIWDKIRVSIQRENRTNNNIRRVVP